MEREQGIERRQRYESKAQSSFTARLSSQETTQLTDRFAMLQLFKMFDMWEEFKVNGEWTAGVPGGKVEEKRIAFPDTTQLTAAKDAYFNWQTMAERKVDSPVNPEEIFKRLAMPRIGNMIMELFAAPRWWLGDEYPASTTLFVPWGVRPEGKFGRSEIEVLNLIQSLRDCIRRNRTGANVLLMPADLYATEVNNQVEPKKAQAYFSQVAQQAKTRGFEVKPWSEIRSENQGRYQERAIELTQDELIRVLGREYVEEAVETARRRSGYRKEKDIVNAALAYLKERICSRNCRRCV